ncbi:MAG TPA: DUF4230 domain-containing protein [Segetibacter sp.]|nr:DUF4230 domain-containing protein [Segetibacter sp.]
MRKLRYVIITVIIIIATYQLMPESGALRSWEAIFAARPMSIDKTPILIKEIKSIGQLITYTSYDEVVADSVIVTRGSAFVNAFNRLSPVPLLPSADKQLVLIVRGKVLVGTDLSMLTDTSVTIKDDTVTLVLPKPKIFEAIVNPSDFETFVEKGNWTSKEVMLVKIKARRKLEARALQQNILAKADIKAKTILQNFLGTMGYKNVLIY